MISAQVRIVGLMAAAIAMTGCSDKAAVGSASAPSLKETVAAAVGAVAPPALPKIDTSSPDFALKSWWAYLDAQQEHQVRLCKKYAAEIKEFQDARGLLLAGDPLQVSRERAGWCHEFKVERQIKKVDVETETRSVIHVVMKDAVGPMADEVVPSYAKEGVERGFPYRYVMVKTPDGWRVEDVLQWSETAVVLKRDPWVRVYKVEPKGYFFNLPNQ